jgi:anaerobic ribonucleoside-triphosphate reductase activating protein
MMEARIAQIVACTQAEGPGRRFAIWFQGCPLRCAECCNPEMLSFEGGQAVSLNEINELIATAQQGDQIEGITLLGGEPFAHAQAGREIARAAQSLGLSVMIFSGFTLSDLRAETNPDIDELLSATDLLVDGPYDQTQPDKNRRWIGSTNQQIHFLTDRYSANDAYWSEPNTLEIRLEDGDLSVNGFPAKQAVGLWTRPKIANG